jgi:hypothetical protein
VVTHTRQDEQRASVSLISSRERRDQSTEDDTARSNARLLDQQNVDDDQIDFALAREIKETRHFTALFCSRRPPYICHLLLNWSADVNAIADRQFTVCVAALII